MTVGAFYSPFTIGLTKTYLLLKLAKQLDMDLNLGKLFGVDYKYTISVPLLYLPTSKSLSGLRHESLDMRLARDLSTEGQFSG